MHIQNTFWKKNWAKRTIPALSSGQSNLQTPIWGCHRQLDDQYRNPNMNNKDHLVGQLTRWSLQKSWESKVTHSHSFTLDRNGAAKNLFHKKYISVQSTNPLYAVTLQRSGTAHEIEKSMISFHLLNLMPTTISWLLCFRWDSPGWPQCPQWNDWAVETVAD